MNGRGGGAGGTRIHPVGRFVCRTGRRVDRQVHGSGGSAPTDGRRGRLIARYRRRRPTLAPGAASIQAPTYARDGGRPSGRTPIYSGRAASASSRRSRYSRAAAAAVAGDHASVRAARSPGDRSEAACRGPEAVREAYTWAVRVGPRRCAANRRWRRRRRSVRWCATANADSWRVLYLICNRGCRYISLPVLRPGYAGHQGCYRMSRRLAGSRGACRRSYAAGADGPIGSATALRFGRSVLGEQAQYLRLIRVKITAFA